MISTLVGTEVLIACMPGTHRRRLVVSTIIAASPLPSGRMRSKFEYATAEIIGNVGTATALIDNRDIGNYVARRITDPDTLNKMISAYGEVWTRNRIKSALKTMSGEKVIRTHVSP